MSAAEAEKKTIVVADQRGPERQVLEAVLSRLGYTVLTVESPAGLEETLVGSVDLVILSSSVAGEQSLDMARSLSRPDRRVVLVDADDRGHGDMVGFIDLTEDTLLGVGVRVPELVLIINDLLFSRAGVPRRRRRVYGGFPATFEHEGKTFEASLFNLSGSGAFVETSSTLACEECIQLKFELPKAGAFDFSCRVTWRVKPDETEGRRSPPGMGLQFLDISDEDLEHIRRFVAAGGRL